MRVPSTVTHTAKSFSVQQGRPPTVLASEPTIPGILVQGSSSKTSSGRSTPQCGICFGALKNPLRMQCCKKVSYCLGCVIRALREMGKCPMCRKEYTLEEVNELEDAAIKSPEEADQPNSSNKNIEPPGFGERDELIMYLTSKGLDDVIKQSNSQAAALFQLAETAIEDKNLIKGGCIEDQLDSDGHERVMKLAEVTDGLTKYAEIKKAATLIYDPEPGLSKIISLEFNSSNKKFLVAGNSPIVKVYDFQNFRQFSTDKQFPSVELDCNVNVANVSWSPHNDTLASVDVNGDILIWENAESRRCSDSSDRASMFTTVCFSPTDANLLVSCGRNIVKLWDVLHTKSKNQIDTQSIVNCVCFAPRGDKLVIGGSADHCVNLYDIRNTKKPGITLQGHESAVSHVSYINDNEIFSTSTDGSLRVWDLRAQKCTQISIHPNKKLFGNLSVNGNHVLCGSEGDSAYLYYKGAKNPQCTYIFHDDVRIDQPERFATAVSWMKGTHCALVGNDKGEIHLVDIF